MDGRIMGDLTYFCADACGKGDGTATICLDLLQRDGDFMRIEFTPQQAEALCEVVAYAIGRLEQVVDIKEESE